MSPARIKFFLPLLYQYPVYAMKGLLHFLPFVYANFRFVHRGRFIQGANILDSLANIQLLKSLADKGISRKDAKECHNEVDR